MRLELTYDEKDREILSRMAFAENRIYVARTLIPEGYERYFQESAQYLSVHTSTAIEGNPMDEEGAMLVLVEGADPQKPVEVEKVNLSEAYELMGLLAADPTTRIDEGIIRTINSMVLRGLPDARARNRGRYRVGASLIVDDKTREVRYRPPRAELVPQLMEQLILDVDKWRHEYAAPICAALLHFGLISVHPFEDGNGRTARLVADMVLRLGNWSANGMISVSEAIHRRLADYYQSLRNAQGEEFRERVDATPFVRFHTRALAEAAVRLEEKAVAFTKQRDEFARLTQGELNERQVTGLMFMFHLGSISTTHYSRLADTSHATALADLNALIEKGLVRRVGRGKNIRYALGRAFARGGRDSRGSKGED